jgi:steroid delta-isomerase-like uncharacterized protein
MSTTTDAKAAETLERDFVEDFAQRWGEAWEKRDGQALGALCAEDVEFFDPAIGTVRGRAAVAEWVEACARAFPDYRFEETERPYISVDQPKVIMPWRMEATHTGPIDPPGFAATGRAVTIEGVDHWWFRDGLVERYRADYDSMDVSRQLGLMPRRGSRMERGMAALQRVGSRLRRG